MNLTGKGGFQERKQHINRKGRPRSFDQIRALTQAIAHEKITDGNGEVMTRVERILRDWSESKDVQKQIAFVQYGYGKPVESHCWQRSVRHTTANRTGSASEIRSTPRRSLRARTPKRVVS